MEGKGRESGKGEGEEGTEWRVSDAGWGGCWWECQWEDMKQIKEKKIVRRKIEGESWWLMKGEGERELCIKTTLCLIKEHYAFLSPFTFSYHFLGTQRNFFYVHSTLIFIYLKLYFSFSVHHIREHGRVGQPRRYVCQVRRLLLCWGAECGREEWVSSIRMLPKPHTTQLTPNTDAHWMTLLFRVNYYLHLFDSGFRCNHDPRWVKDVVKCWMI